MAVLLPALKASMGDWVYYVATMPFDQVALYIKKTDEVHRSATLSEWIQRALTGRSHEIAEYLRREEQRFFNAIIVGIYGGEPMWHPIDISPSPTLSEQLPDFTFPDRISAAMGILALTGQEKIFAVDGQHRVQAIKEVVASDGARFSTEDQTVIFIAHRETIPGRERTRRLFTTLNRYAKKVSDSEIVALDEDDAFAIVTRRLVEEYAPLSGGRVLFSGSARVPSWEAVAVTSILALYRLVQEIYLPQRAKSRAQRKSTLIKKRPPDDTLSEIYDCFVAFWEAVIASVSAIEDVCTSPESRRAASRHRHAEGGHLLLRPVGQVAFAQATRACIEAGISLDEAVSRLATRPMELSDRPWLHLVWDPEKRTVNHKPKRICFNLLLYMIGQRTPMRRDKLLEAYRRETGQPRISLPRARSRW